MADEPLFSTEPPCDYCSGNGADEWPENPSICGGLPCPVCNGICPECVARKESKRGE